MSGCNGEDYCKIEVKVPDGLKLAKQEEKRMTDIDIPVIVMGIEE